MNQMMNNAPLTDDELERLATLIDSRFDDGFGPPLEFVDGLLSAVVVSPTLIPPSEYMPIVFGEDGAWETLDQAQEAMTLLLRFNNQIAGRIALPLGDDDEMIEDHMPLLMLPESDVADDDLSMDDLPEGFPFAAAWADGFLLGINLRGDAFEVLENELDWLGDDLDGLTDLLRVDLDEETAAAEELGVPAEPLPTIDQRFEKAMQIPFMLHALFAHRTAHAAPAGPQQPVRVQATPGRNDLCRCGSGKKYKKCCGVN